MSTLSQHLKDNNISQRAFAAQLGVHTSIVSRLVSRTMRPSLDLAVRIERQTGGVISAVSWIESDIDDQASIASECDTKTQEDAA